MAKTQDITVAEIREAFEYDPETGEIRWKKDACTTRPRGSLAGGLNTEGYRYIKYLGISLRASRVAWAIILGEWPTLQVDHINANRSDDRWINLRAANVAENCQNRNQRSDNSSGFTGVHFHLGKWQARIGVNGKRISLGHFDSKEAARKAYLAAKQKYHPFQPVPRGEA